MLTFLADLADLIDILYSKNIFNQWIWMGGKKRVSIIPVTAREEFTGSRDIMMKTPNKCMHGVYTV